MPDAPLTPYQLWQPQMSGDIVTCPPEGQIIPWLKTIALEQA